MQSKIEYPPISIGIPTYNRNIGILRTLKSIWAQNYPNYEIVISDNCSTDNTKEVLLELAKEHSEIKYHRQEKNIGMIPNFEFVRKNATGKYFMWVSDDDVLEPGALLKYVAFLEKNPAYSLVSGEIRYWGEHGPDFNEKGFTFEQNWPALRTVLFYFKVIWGGMIHGMMRRELAKNVSLRKVIGNDYHFVANLVYLGKVKNFDFVGYNKSFGGTSKTFKQYAKAMGESEFAGNFPHKKMAGDAFREVMSNSTVFGRLSSLPKLTLAILSFQAVFLCYYLKIFPFKIGGIIKRFILKPFAAREVDSEIKGARKPL
jgi:glycosyltransferase involved in cell wall biosynthesis